MDCLPPIDSAQGVTFTVADFVEAGRDRLRLCVIVGGSGLAHMIGEPLTNRPGLALTGFFDDFAWERIQLIGNAESAYILSLGEDKWLERFDQMIQHGAYAFVFTSGHVPCERAKALAEKSGVVVLATSFSTQDFSRNAAFVLEQLGAPRTSIYGTMVEVCGLGVLFEGDPGLGKSETALGLIKRGGSLVADDLTCIRRGIGTDVLYASASESTAGYMEIRGIGILHVPSVFGINALRGEKRLQLVITFKRLQDIRGEVDRIGQTRRTRSILGVDVPNIIIPVSEGRDLVNLVETAAQQQKLINAGYDPVRDLSERLHKRANKPML